MRRYNPKEIEPKWQKVWEDSKIYQADDNADKPKQYILEYFPYPSGSAMHVGHVRNYAIGDAMSRYSRMRGNNVLHPMGWDAFGLPAENYAIKTGISPQQAIAQNTAKFKQQLTQMGFSYDWSREIFSSDPEYYKWTQWLFILLLERGLAYQNESLQWWCPVDKTVLANEQVEAGKCWRCGNEVIKKPLKQWFFKITDYADRLVEDLDKLDWSESLKSMQRNWIGKSKGAEIDFDVESAPSASGELAEHTITVFTTRPDTLYGATFMVLAPEYPLVEKIVTVEQREAVTAYQKSTLKKSEVDRMATDREKTGVFTGGYALNPVNGAKVPIWIADYVLSGYGTGAIMAVPAHDERDHEFATKYQLPIIEVVQPPQPVQGCYLGEGKMINSGQYDGLDSFAARDKIVADLAAGDHGREQVNYKIRDWLISRQRYWGAPIPVIHCPTDGAVAVPQEQLPVVLPDMESYEPSGDGRSPLARLPEFVHTTCPKCGGPAQRETDTMDGFACSSWYFLRFADPHNSEKAFDADKVKAWLPVDSYIGGAEHAVMHLLYARMWTKVMFDAGLIDFDEPFRALRNQGMMLAPDGQKMSKSKGNVIAPDELIEQGYGADTIRLMELFIGPWNQEVAWSIEGMGGCFRFLQRVWTLTHEIIQANPGTDIPPETEQAQFIDRLNFYTHSAIKRVTTDLEDMGFNTSIAALMEFTNELYKLKMTLPPATAHSAWQLSIKSLLLLLAPFAPHITEELWHDLGETTSIHVAEWPQWDEALLKTATMTIVIQVNGKVRASIEVDSSADQATIEAAALADGNVQNYLNGSTPLKSIYVPGKLLSLVVK